MKYSVRFDLKRKADTMPRIRLRITWGGQRVEMLTGMRVDDAYWVPQVMRVRSTYRHEKDTGASINKQLAAIEVFVDSVFSRAHVEGTVPTVAQMKSELGRYFGVSEQACSPSIYDYLNIFIDTQSKLNGWTNGTTTKFRTLKKHLYAFAPQLTFSDLNEDGLRKFMQFLLDSGMRNTTLHKTLGFLKWYLRWAVRRGYTDNTAFLDFQPHFKGVDGNSKEIIYLEWDELMTLYNFDFSKRPGLANVRDVFCFCAFTGLRYSDAAKLHLSDIHDNYISVVTQKTADGLRIELNAFSRAILERHTLFQQDKRQNPRRLALPTISNQKMNAYLKDAGRLAGLDAPVRTVYYRGSERYESENPKWELLTTHCARRTFVVNSLSLGIPAEVIMKWTGHSGFNAMKPYVKIVDNLKEMEMSKFDTLYSDSSPKIPQK